jgi:hypothetical protein
MVFTEEIKTEVKKDKNGVSMLNNKGEEIKIESYIFS